MLRSSPGPSPFLQQAAAGGGTRSRAGHGRWLSPLPSARCPPVPSLRLALCLLTLVAASPSRREKASNQLPQPQLQASASPPMGQRGDPSPVGPGGLQAASDWRLLLARRRMAAAPSATRRPPLGLPHAQAAREGHPQRVLAQVGAGRVPQRCPRLPPPSPQPPAAPSSCLPFDVAVQRP